MRQYGQVQCSLWGHPDFQELTSESKTLFLYLLTGPHSNGLGCYRLPNGYIEADLNWTNSTVSKRFTELFQNGFAMVCETTKFVFIPGFLKWNPCANTNVAKSRQKEFEDIPSKFSYSPALARDMLQYIPQLTEPFRNRLETVTQPVSKQEPNRTEPNQIGTNMSGRPNDASQDDDQPEPEAQDSNDLVNVLEYLNQKSGRCFKPVETNLELIRGRLNEGYTLADLIRVIDLKCEKWLGDQKMESYLRPLTLFGKEKFSQYVGEASAPRPKSNKDQLDDWVEGNDDDSNVIEGDFVSHG